VTKPAAVQNSLVLLPPYTAGTPTRLPITPMYATHPVHLGSAPVAMVAYPAAANINAVGINPTAPYMGKPPSMSALTTEGSAWTSVSNPANRV
jgi:hypothetical protein